MDAAGAFDASSHKFIDEALCRAFGDSLEEEEADAELEDFGNRKLRRLVRDIYSKAADRAQVRRADGFVKVSETIRRYRGSMQGDCLSPLIFLVVLAAVLNECDPSTLEGGNGNAGIRIGNVVLSRLEYADDMVFMVDVFAHLADRLQEVADNMAELADLGLHL